ncbi:MAG: hypothetical protein ACM3N4_11030 [Nitrososphaerota archaeon]
MVVADATGVADVASTDEHGSAGSVISFTRHARRRGARRNVAPDAVDYVLAHGRMLQRTGVMFFFLGRRDIPSCDRCASWASRLEGTIVIVAENGEVVTVYRNRQGLRPIARKMKYRLFERDQPRDDAGECSSEEPPPVLPAMASASA